MRKVDEVLQELKGFVGGVATTTSRVLTLPSNFTNNLARKIADDVKLEGIVRDLAVIAARDVATNLSSLALRAADYADIRDIPDTVLERLIDDLAKKPDLFFDTFKEQMKLKG